MSSSFIEQWVESFLPSEKKSRADGVCHRVSSYVAVLVERLHHDDRTVYCIQFLVALRSSRHHNFCSSLVSSAVCSQQTKEPAFSSSSSSALLHAHIFSYSLTFSLPPPPPPPPPTRNMSVVVRQYWGASFFLTRSLLFLQCVVMCCCWPMSRQLNTFHAAAVTCLHHILLSSSAATREREREEESKGTHARMHKWEYQWTASSSLVSADSSSRAMQQRRDQVLMELLIYLLNEQQLGDE